MSQTYGYCEKHPNLPMINCPMCEAESMSESAPQKIEVGSVVINNDYKNDLFKKQITIDFNGPYLSLTHFDKIRKAVEEILKNYGQQS